VATGQGTTYQWQVSTDGGLTFVNMPGETGATLTLTGVTAALDQYQYQVIVTGCATSVTSSPATLTIATAGSITGQPSNATVCVGSDATFTATATGSSYQWQVSTDGGATFTDIAGATTTTLTLTGVTAAMNNNQYHLVVGSCGSSTITSNNATLTVTAPATITTQPAASISACDGGAASTSVVVSGTATYQWQASIDGGATWNDIPGETGSSLSYPTVTLAMSGLMVRVVVTSPAPCGSVTSDASTLTVNAVPTVGASVSDDEVCEGELVTFTGSGATTYTWDNGVTNGVAIPATTGGTFTVTGTTAGCSATATVNLTVNPAPDVTISASPYQNLLSGLTTTLTANSASTIVTYEWLKDGGTVTGATGSTHIVTHSQLGSYSVNVTDDLGCTATSNVVVIGDSVQHFAFISPNPSRGQFTVKTTVTPGNTLPRIVSIYDSKGSRVFQQVYTVSSSQTEIEVNVESLNSGVYMLDLSDASGKRLQTGQVLIVQ
jgi:hypothetical protein